jgi:CBS domain containing-hemolysin-like protein
MDPSILSAIAPHLAAMTGLIFASAFFSGSETAFFALSRATRERLSRSERSVDRYVAVLAAEPKRLIATLLLGNEFVNISFAALSTIITERMFRGWDASSIALIATAITVPFLLLIGEILPKTVALATSEGWARVASRPLGFFMWATTPLRLVVTLVANGVLRLLGQHKEKPVQQLGEAELKALVDVGSEVGELEQRERHLIHKVFDFGDRTVAEVMTPVGRTFSLSFELPLARVVAEVARSGYSRVPVHRGKKQERQEIVGVIFAKDLVGTSSGRLAGKTLKDLVRPVAYVPKTSKCAQVFADFQRSRNHFAIVVDEYGRQVGLVTMEDLLRALFGRLGQEPRGSVPRAVDEAPSGPLTGPPPPPPGEEGLS